MNIIRTAIPDLVIIQPKVFGDARGFFLETFNVQRYRAIPQIQKTFVHPEGFVQDNHSHSAKGVLRGLHFQQQYPQGKLVWVTSGEVYDVAVDIRKHSPTFGRWVGVTLRASEHQQFYVPPGFAHGFCVMSPTADFHYKCTEYYHPEDEGSILWNDAELGINWPTPNPTLSAKDNVAGSLRDYLQQL